VHRDHVLQEVAAHRRIGERGIEHGQVLAHERRAIEPVRDPLQGAARQPRGVRPAAAGQRDEVRGARIRQQRRQHGRSDHVAHGPGLELLEVGDEGVHRELH
jgi:hypothetical protein